jgi:hemoglobin
MKQDIETRADIDRLLTSFYNSVRQDGKIGHHFATLDLESHLPIITNFWEKILFGNQVYFGNPLAVHQILHERSPLKLEHFVRWVEVFGQTVDALFAGDNAEKAKTRAGAIAATLGGRLNGGIQISHS